MTGVTTSDLNKLKPDDIRRYTGLTVYSPCVHQSHLSDWWTCPRYYFMKYRLGLRPKMQLPGALDLGQAAHAALEVLYTTGDMVEASVAVNRMMVQKQDSIRAAASDTGQLDRADGLCARIEENAAVGLTLAGLFYNANPLDSNEFRVLKTEFGAEDLTVVGLDAKIGGRIDALIYSRRFHGLFILDFKTVAAKTDLTTYGQHLGYDFQGRWYRILASEILLRERPIEFAEPGTDEMLSTADLPILGFMICAMLKPTISQKMDQSLDEFMEELKDYYSAQRGGAHHRKHADPFKMNGEPRKGVDRDGYMIDDDGTRKVYYKWDHTDLLSQWQASAPYQVFTVKLNEPILPADVKMIAELVGRASRCLPTVTNFPRFGELTGHCRNMYGRPCQFSRLCSVHPRNWMSIINDEFRAEDPTETNPANLRAEDE